MCRVQGWIKIWGFYLFIWGLFNHTFSIETVQHYVVDMWMRNWKGCGRKHSRPHLRYYPIICLGNEENHKRPLSEQLVSQVRSEPGTYQLHGRSITTWVNLHDKILLSYLSPNRRLFSLGEFIQLHPLSQLRKALDTQPPIPEQSNT
jgi:hypothetical protein